MTDFFWDGCWRFIIDSKYLAHKCLAQLTFSSKVSNFSRHRSLHNALQVQTLADTGHCIMRCRYRKLQREWRKWDSLSEVYAYLEYHCSFCKIMCLNKTLRLEVCRFINRLSVKTVNKIPLLSRSFILINLNTSPNEDAFVGIRVTSDKLLLHAPCIVYLCKKVTLIQE